MMAAAGVLAAATAGIAHGEREDSGPSPSIHKERVMGVCLAVEIASKEWVSTTSVNPASSAAMYMRIYAKQPLSSFLPFDSIRITQQPSYGTLIREKNSVGRDIYVYRPNVGYLGKDRIEAVVTVGDDAVRIIYNFVVQPNPTEREDFDSRKYCPKTEWKISLATPSLDNNNL